MSLSKNVCVIGALFVMGLVTSLQGFAQTQELVSAPEGKKADKVDFLYKASQIALIGGGGLDFWSTRHLMGHPTLASRPDGTEITRYYGVETGWARIFGQRNTFAATSANVALDLGTGLLARNLYRRGGRWRIAAVAVLSLKAADSTLAGIHNIRYNADVNRRVRLRTGYAGPIVWSH